MEAHIANRLQRSLGNLTEKQQEIANLILSDPEWCSYASVGDVAKRLQMDPATVVRFAQQQGFKGFSDLRRNIRHHYLATLRPLDALLEHERSRDNRSSNNIDIVLNQDIKNLVELRRSLDAAAVHTIASRIVEARKTLIVATGSHASIGMILAHQCHFMGWSVELENRGGSYLSQRLSSITSQDHVIGISFWRPSPTVVRALKWAQGHDIPVSAISDQIFSPILESADVSVITPTEGTAFFQSLVAPLSAVHAVIQMVRNINPEHADRHIQLSHEAYDYLLGGEEPNN
ncbi:MAG TPA: MurR/RpiR family transcriptional regulator [Trueperaceae bacterium]